MRRKSHLVSAVVDVTGVDSETVTRVVDAVLTGIVVLVAEDEDEMLVLNGFGTFKAVHRKASVTRNPRTGERMDVPASTRLGFKAAKEKRA